MSNKIFGDPIPLLEGERLSSAEVDLPFQEGFEAADRASLSGYSWEEQKSIASKVIEDNVSKERLEAAGLSTEEIRDHIVGGFSSSGSQVASAYDLLPSSLRKQVEERVSGDLEFRDAEKALAIDKKLKAAGIDAEELQSRYMSNIKSDLKGDERAGLLASITGGIKGYLSDPWNVGALFVGPGGLARSGASMGVQLSKIALGNMAVESALMARLDTPLEEKVIAAVGAGVGGAALAGAGRGLGELKNTVLDIFNKSRLAKDVARNAEKVIEKMPEGRLRADFREEIAFIDTIGGTFDDAMNIRYKVGESIAEGKFPGKVVEGFKVELPGRTVKGSTREELMANLRVELESANAFDRFDVEDALNRLDEQEFVGNVDRYRVVTEEIPMTERKKTFIERPDGTKKEVKAKYRHLIFDSREAAESAIKSKKLDDVQVVAQNNGRYAVVREADEAVQMPGTARFPSKAKAEAKLEEYSRQFGVDIEDLSIERVPSFSEKYDFDYIISNIGSAGRFARPETATNTFLDTMSITKFKDLSDASDPVSLDFAKGEQAKVYFKSRDMLETRQLREEEISKDMDRYIDQLVEDDTIVFDIPDVELNPKKFNGLLKQTREVLKDFKKDCI